MGHYKNSEDWVRQYLEAHPDASVDEVARAAADADVAVYKDLISRVRNFFRQVEQDEESVIPNLVQRTFELATPKCRRCGGPHWISQCLEVEVVPIPEPVPEPVPEVSEEPVMTAPTPEVLPEVPRPRPTPGVGSSRSMEGTLVRRKRLNELVDAEPGIHPLEALVKLRSEFGIGLDLSYIWETCRVARQMNGLPPLTERDESQGRASPTPAEELPLTADDELRWMASRVSEIIRAHNLSDLTLKLESGVLTWEYEIRVKKSGKQTL